MTVSPLHIRQATPLDADEIARVHVEATRAAYRGIYTDEYLAGLSIEDRARLWVEEGKGALVVDGYTVFVAEIEGRIIGFAAVGPAGDPTQEERAELYALYLDPPSIGQGIGKALFIAAADHLRNRGLARLVTHVLSQNTQARAFYEKMGGQALADSETLEETGGTQANVISYVWQTL